MLGSIGMPELIILLVIVLIIFGAGKLSEIGGALGGGIREFRKAAQNEGDEPAGDDPQLTAE
jgi:sec-independent protein translocase protein TatA